MSSATVPDSELTYSLKDLLLLTTRLCRLPYKIIYLLVRALLIALGQTISRSGSARHEGCGRYREIG